MRLHPVDLPGEEPTVLGLGQLAGLGLATLPAAQDGNHFFPEDFRYLLQLPCGGVQAGGHGRAAFRRGHRRL